MKYKEKYEELLSKYNDHEEFEREVRSLLNYILRIKRKCENENLWLMASMDPHKDLLTEQQQGPMISRMFEMILEIKKKWKK